MAGKLYLVGTPIGNLGDVSPRCAETLAAADFVAAEDTRVALRLLNHLGIKKPLVSYYQHNRAGSGERIVRRLEAGESCALVTDAGMPAVSDPGEDLVRLCAGAGIEVAVVPGPCAAVAALALSGLPSGRFAFEGFLAVGRRSRSERLAELKGEKRTMIFYEAPPTLKSPLADMLEAWGDRRVAVCRELTKLHEETLRMTLSEAAKHFEAVPPRGEFVLVVEGAAPEPPAEGAGLAEALGRVAGLRAEGRSLKDAVKKASEETGLSRNELYEAALRDAED
jgi:16S rRNA (cytidine1402-2'-O)-methyltransferase